MKMFIHFTSHPQFCEVTKGQGPGLVNVLLGTTQQLINDLRFLRRERVCLDGSRKNVHQSWLLALNRPRS